MNCDGDGSEYQIRRRHLDGVNDCRELDRLGYVWKRSRYVLDPDPDCEKKKTDSMVDSQNPRDVAAQCLSG